MTVILPCFKAYDIRGRVGPELNEEICRGVGRAFVRVTGAEAIVLGRDIRDSSERLADSIAEGAQFEGAEVMDLGLCGTEEVYFATDHLGAGGGLMVTASHNPIGDNGVKLIGAGARPIRREAGLGAMHDMVAAEDFGPGAAQPGRRRPMDVRAAYVEKVLRFVEPARLRPLKIVVNAGNGAAGPTFDAIAHALARAGAPLEFVRLHHAPDGSFPNGIPNPLLPENRPVTGDAVLAESADMGVAWDGDFDRCFLFDERGGFVDGEYVVGLLAAAMLGRSPGARIVHDPRVMWNTVRIVREAGGEAVVSPTGHALIKEKMREVDAVYGGEMSAHHYFRDFMYCDSGMIPWLLIAAHMSHGGQPLSALVGKMRDRHPSSGEINFRLADPGAALAAVEAEFAAGGRLDRLDGLNLAFEDWRFSLRKSNTEPMVRLNVETLGDRAALDRHVRDISEVLRRFA